MVYTCGSQHDMGTYIYSVISGDSTYTIQLYTTM